MAAQERNLGQAFIRMFGPNHATTPDGHPIQISSPVFDINEQAPVDAIIAAIKKWHKVDVKSDDLRVVQEYDVIDDPRMNGKHHKVYYFEYLPEAELLETKGLTGKVVNHFETSWYLRKTGVEIPAVKELPKPVTGWGPDWEKKALGKG